MMRDLLEALEAGVKVRVTKPRGGMIVRAYVGKTKVGNLTVHETLRYMEVDKAMVLPEYRRQGVATMMYRRAAEVACKDFGKPLASLNYQSSPDAKAFWRAEVSRGKAIKVQIQGGINDGERAFQYRC